MSAPIVEYRGISKHFSGIRALEDVDFACHSGTIHAILGENGAGKSTLIKIMSGVLTPDSGEMLLEGKPTAFATPDEATRAGVVCMFQELSLIPDLTVADNISISDPPRRFGAALLWEPSAEEEAVLRADWEDLVGRIGAGEVESIDATRGRWLQLRPKGRNARARQKTHDADGAPFWGPVRAFYLRALVTRRLLEEAGFVR